MAELQGKTVSKDPGTSIRPTRHVGAKVAPAQSAQQSPRLRRKSVSFQIRTSPETKELAERVASDHGIRGRSKLDADIYKRGLLLTMLLLGPGPDGSYSGQSEQELARQLEPLFDRQYAVLDSHQLLASYVYRVLPPGGAGGIALLSMEQQMNLAGHQDNPGQQHVLGKRADDDQMRYQLSEHAQANLENFAEEI